MRNQYRLVTDSESAQFQLAKTFQKTKETISQYYERYKALANRASIGIQHESYMKDTICDAS